MKQIRDRLRGARRILLAAHVNPDADSVASLCVLGGLLARPGRRVVLFSRGAPRQRFPFLVNVEQVTSFLPARRWDVLVSLDTTSRDRLALPAGVHADCTINIDHHPSNENFGDLNCVRPQASSTCELIYELAREAHWRLDRPLAEALYLGVFAETGGFAYPNTTPRVFRICARLLDYGIEQSALARRLAATTPANLRLLSRVLATLEVAGPIASVTLTDAMKRAAGALRDLHGDTFVRYPMALEGVRVALLFRVEGRNTVRVSFRSEDDFDVDALAQSFGGGGHRNAAGARLTGSLRAVKARVLARTREALACAGS